MVFLRLLLLSLLLLLPLPALAYDALLLQSKPDPGYEEAIKGFRREFHGSVRRIVLSEYAEADVIRITREEHPKLVVAVGDRALETALRQSTTPVLYMMALNTKRRRWATGVSMLVEPSRYVATFQTLGLERVGVLYDQGKSGPYVKRAQGSAGRSVDLVTREVHAPKETPSMLESLRGKVDAVWLIPDPTAVTTSSTEAFFLFSQGERVPVIAFSDYYLKIGAAVALTIDRYDIGRQLGEMAQSVLEGTPVDEVTPEWPRKVSISFNDGVVRRLRMGNAAGRLK